MSVEEKVRNTKKLYESYISPLPNYFQQTGGILCFIDFIYVYGSAKAKYDINPHVYFVLLLLGFVFSILGFYIVKKYNIDYLDKNIEIHSRFFFSSSSKTIEFSNIKAIGVSMPYIIRSSRYSTNKEYLYEIFFIYYDGLLHHEILEFGSLGKDKADRTLAERINCRVKEFANRFENVEFYNGHLETQIRIVNGKIKLCDSNEFSDVDHDRFAVSKFYVFLLGILVAISAYFIYQPFFNFSYFNSHNISVSGNSLNSTNMKNTTTNTKYRKRKRTIRNQKYNNGYKRNGYNGNY